MLNEAASVCTATYIATCWIEFRNIADAAKRSNCFAQLTELRGGHTIMQCILDICIARNVISTLFFLIKSGSYCFVVAFVVVVLHFILQNTS